MFSYEITNNGKKYTVEILRGNFTIICKYFNSKTDAQKWAEMQVATLNRK